MEQLIKELNIKLNNNLIEFSKYLKNLMIQKESYQEDIKEEYSKKLIYSGKFDVYLIYWKKNFKTKIHDHATFGCLMRILEGKLRERRYDNQLIEVSKNIHQKNNVSYIEGSKILHDIEALENSISLHVYSPARFQTTFYEKLDDKIFSDVYI
jgi:predicted metal-dependent enzyme (double-stranded beta helix superfamily)